MSVGERTENSNFWPVEHTVERWQTELNALFNLSGRQAPLRASGQRMGWQTDDFRLISSTWTFWRESSSLSLHSGEISHDVCIIIIYFSHSPLTLLHSLARLLPPKTSSWHHWPCSCRIHYNQLQSVSTASYDASLPSFYCWEHVRLLPWWWRIELLRPLSYLMFLA